MRQSSVTIPYEEEKLTALRRYMGKKELELEAEMLDALTKLYEKYVPAPVREYIDENDTPAPPVGKQRRSQKSAEAKQNEQRQQTVENQEVM
ncbi:MAG: hypothetical protein IKC03_00265 [Oscillospiraceae bacterium]|nr:hypothetical protein [Oscillospiraceae bacterium]